MLQNKKSLRNIKLVIEYDGSNYCGWQWQKGQISIQEMLARVVKQITGRDAVIHGASRTDSGVHAVGQVANFLTQAKLSTFRLLRALNGNLPHDIVVKSVSEVPAAFNACFKAKSKTYIYTILNRRISSPLNRAFVWFISGKKLDIKLMKKAAVGLKGHHNFRAFASESHKNKNYVRTISSISITEHDGFIYIKVTGNGFLYNMVRAIVGTLVQVGQGKITPKEVKKILISHDRKRAGPTAPARGLCLMKVRY